MHKFHLIIYINPNRIAHFAHKKSAAQSRARINELAAEKHLQLFISVRISRAMPVKIALENDLSSDGASNCTPIYTNVHKMHLSLLTSDIFSYYLILMACVSSFIVILSLTFIRFVKFFFCYCSVVFNGSSSIL